MRFWQFFRPLLVDLDRLFSLVIVIHDSWTVHFRNIWSVSFEKLRFQIVLNRLLPPVHFEAFDLSISLSCVRLLIFEDVYFGTFWPSSFILFEPFAFVIFQWQSSDLKTVYLHLDRNRGFRKDLKSLGKMNTMVWTPNRGPRTPFELHN